MRSILSFSIVSIILFVVSCTRDAEVIVKNTGDNPDMVAYYQLRGYHIRAGEALINDLKRLYGANGAMAIPWNMIVDSHGSIVQLHAPRPSDPMALSAALDTVD